MPVRCRLLVCCLCLPMACASLPAQQADPNNGVAGAAAAATSTSLVEAAWQQLESAANARRDADARVAARGALSLLGGQPRAEKLVVSAMADPDIDIRLAAVVAAGEMAALAPGSLPARLRRLLDDPDSKMAFTAASTL